MFVSKVQDDLVVKEFSPQQVVLRTQPVLFRRAWSSPGQSCVCTSVVNGVDKGAEIAFSMKDPFSLSYGKKILILGLVMAKTIINCVYS